MTFKTGKTHRPCQSKLLFSSREPDRLAQTGRVEKPRSSSASSPLCPGGIKSLHSKEVQSEGVAAKIQPDFQTMQGVRSDATDCPSRSAQPGVTRTSRAREVGSTPCERPSETTRTAGQEDRSCQDRPNLDFNPLNQPVERSRVDHAGDLSWAERCALGGSRHPSSQESQPSQSDQLSPSLLVGYTVSKGRGLGTVRGK